MQSGALLHHGKCDLLLRRIRLCLVGVAVLVSKLAVVLFLGYLRLHLVLVNCSVAFVHVSKESLLQFVSLLECLVFVCLDNFNLTDLDVFIVVALNVVAALERIIEVVVHNVSDFDVEEGVRVFVVSLGHLHLHCLSLRTGNDPAVVCLLDAC